MSRMDYGGEEAKRKSSEATPDCRLLGSAAQEADRVGLGFRSGAILRYSPTAQLPSCLNNTCLAHERQYLEQSPQVTALFYWEQNKERMERTCPAGPVGSWTQPLWGAGIVPPSRARAPWQGCFITRLSMGFWQWAGHCQKGL